MTLREWLLEMWLALAYYGLSALNAMRQKVLA